MPVLRSDSGLEAVVVAVGGVLLLVDARETLIGTQLIRDRDALATRIRSRVVARIACVCTGIARLIWINQQWCIQRVVIDLPLDVLVPRQVANVLHNPEDRRCYFTLD